MGVKDHGTHLRTIQSWANRTRPKDAVRLKSHGGKHNKWHQIHYRPPFAAVPPLRSPDRTVMPSTVPEMAPPLRPEPPNPGLVPSFGLTQERPPTERKAGSSASSYWSVSEATDFPSHLSAFGSDWVKLAEHMGTKTSVMVKNYYLRQKENGKKDWEERVREADEKRRRGEELPQPPPPQPVPGASGYPSPLTERPQDSAVVNVVRTISRDNTTGDDHKRSQCMATLGLKHNKVRSSGS